MRKQEFYRRVGNDLVKIEDERNNKIPLIYIWKLLRITGTTAGIEMGRYMMPTEDIGNGLDAEWIALNLNNVDGFDFEYHPIEGDTLFITQNQEMAPYISFIYRNCEWVIDHYNPFDFTIQELRSGKIESQNKNVT